MNLHPRFLIHLFILMAVGVCCSGLHAKARKKVVEVTKKKEILKEHFTDKRDTLCDVCEDDKEGKEKNESEKPSQ